MKAPDRRKTITRAGKILDKGFHPQYISRDSRNNIRKAFSLTAPYEVVPEGERGEIKAVLDNVFRMWG